MENENEIENVYEEEIPSNMIHDVELNVADEVIVADNAEGSAELNIEEEEDSVELNSEDNVKLVEDANVELNSEDNVESIEDDNVELNSEDNVESIEDDNVESIEDDNVELNSEDNVADNVESVDDDNVELNSEDNVESVEDDNVELNSEDNVADNVEVVEDDNVELNSEDNVADNVEVVEDDNVELNSEDNVSDNVELNLEDNVADNVELILDDNVADNVELILDDNVADNVELVEEDNVADNVELVLDDNEADSVENDVELIVEDNVECSPNNQLKVNEDVVVDQDYQDDAESDFEGFEEEVVTTSKKDGDGAESDFEGFGKETNEQNIGSGIIEDIFGESDEEADFEGFAENEVDKSAQKGELDHLKADDGRDSSSSSSDGEIRNDGVPDSQMFVSDFDTMMDKQKELRRKFHKRGKNSIVINDSDDFIIEMIGRMKNAADEDRELISLHRPAVKKLKLLPEVVDLLKKADMRNAQIDCGILRSITEWLSPLPDKSIPSLPIREDLLKNLLDFPPLSSDYLKDSGIGKAIMFLLKHPKETRKNKDMAAKLINFWSRSIFKLTANYKKLTKEERQERDYANLPKKRSIEGEQNKRDINKEMGNENKALRPGDVGFVSRARVPQPSHKDYVVRPKWNTEKDEDKDEEDEDEGTMKKRRRMAVSGGKKEPSRMEKHMRSIKEANRQSKKVARAVSMSLEGKKLAL